MTQRASRRIGVLAMAIAIVGLTLTTWQQYEWQQRVSCQSAYNVAVGHALKHRADLANQDAANAARDQALNESDRANLATFVNGLFAAPPGLTPEQRRARAAMLKERFDQRAAWLEQEHRLLVSESLALQQQRVDSPLPTNHC